MPDQPGRQSSARHGTSLAISLTALCASFGALSACGGVAVIDPDGGDEGSGGFASVGPVTSSGVSTTSVGAGGTGGVGGTPPGGAPPIPPLVEHPQGDHNTGAPFTFEVEPDTLGVTVIADIPGDLVTIGFQSVEAPNNATIVQNHGIATTAQDYMWWGIDTLLLPQSDHPETMPLMPGTWTFTLGSNNGPQTADVSIWTRHTLDGQFHGGLIDVNVFIANNAVSQSYISSVIDEAFDDFAGLSTGTVTFHTLPNEYSVVTETTWLDPFPESAGAPGKPALNIMIVNLIDFDAIGYSAGIPGSTLVHGTRQSGVVMMAYDPSYDFFTLRHEVGHFSGLLHTSETTPGLGDRLSDTPKCADVDQQLQNCPDINYLMFPYANPAGQAQMSPKQDTIVQASALYRAAVEEGGGYADPLPQNSNVAGDSGGSQALLQPSSQQPGSQRLSNQQLAQDAGIAMTLERANATTNWRVSAGEEVAHFASALWCGTGSNVDHAATLRSIASVAELLSLANDSDAPDYVRMRALSALGGAQLSQAQLGELATMVSDGTLPRLVRLGAWQGLKQASPMRALQLSPKLRLDRDRALRAAARSL